MQQEVVRQCEEILKLTKEQSVLRQQLEEQKEVLDASERQASGVSVFSGHMTPQQPLVPPVMTIIRQGTPSPPNVRTATPVPVYHSTIVTTSVPASKEPLPAEVEMPDYACHEDTDLRQHSAVITQAPQVITAPGFVEPVAQRRSAISPMVIREPVAQVLTMPFTSVGLATTPVREMSPAIRERPGAQEELPPHGSKFVPELSGDMPAPTPEPTEDGMSVINSARGLGSARGAGPYGGLYGGEPNAEFRVATTLPFGVLPAGYRETSATAPLPFSVLPAEPRAPSSVPSQRFWMRPRPVPSIYEVREPSSSPYRSRSPKAA